MKKLVLSRSVLAACAAVFVLAVVLVACQGSDTPTAPEITAPLTTASSYITSGLATPDGDTPSEEAVCDGLTGPAFGLCNSYCEAMDCDFETPNASADACEEVRVQFVDLTSDQPPCEDSGECDNDNIIDPPELCDGTDLGGETCVSQGCSGGTLACSADCSAYDTSSCTGCPAACGNGICEAGNGEDCVSCAADCNGIQGGKPSNRYCCGDGDGQSPVACSDNRCTEGGNTCTDIPA